MTVRTRFAPSPTGYLHIGGVRTALFNWLFARKHGGQFILRIDDTDQERNVEAALEPILEGFRWLGIDWDEGPCVDGPHAPYFQSQRSEQHQAAAKQLLVAGFAYRDYATPEEVQAERESAEKEKRDYVYSRRWMAETDEQAAAFEAEGRKFVVRLKMPRDGKCEFHDLIRGDVAFDWAREQDHVIQRADGSCLYHLASVVDDSDFEITHVIRAAEHLSNTPRQIFIAQSLGCNLPEFAHLPYVAEPSGTAKISKRKLDKYLKNRDFKSLCDHGNAIAAKIGHETTADTFNPVIVDFYREVGYLPDAIINYLLLLGWSLDDKTEEFTRDEMITHFSLERVNKSPASFDPQKLSAFQLRHMQHLPIKQKVALVVPFLQKTGLVASPPPCDTAPHLIKIVEAAGDRIKTAGDILEFDEFFVNDDALPFEEKAFKKRVCKDGAAELLREFRDILASAEPFDRETCEAALRSFIESKEIKIGEIIHALRVAVTGKGVGVGMFEALEILGKDSCLVRIDRCLARADD
ncbi:MAG: glutamate--tRNA ligase [Planctomycetes bacterium]|nr:glutamate--tRNA ligase [Planctomycetota bacterium]